MEEKLYIYALVRADLDMTPGKLSSQSGHAYTDSLSACIDRNPDRALVYRRTSSGGSKVTLEAKNLTQLERARSACEALGIPHALVVDSGHVMLPHFDGSEVVTALGIGPCLRSECREITKKFRCVR